MISYFQGRLWDKVLWAGVENNYNQRLTIALYVHKYCTIPINKCKMLMEGGRMGTMADHAARN